MLVAITFAQDSEGNFFIIQFLAQVTHLCIIHDGRYLGRSPSGIQQSLDPVPLGLGVEPYLLGLCHGGIQILQLIDHAALAFFAGLGALSVLGEC